MFDIKRVFEPRHLLLVLFAAVLMFICVCFDDAEAQEPSIEVIDHDDR